MTEQEWLASDGPAAMLHYLLHGELERPTPSASDRKLRLFAVACCRLNGADPALCDDYEIRGPRSDLIWANNWTRIPDVPQATKAALLRDIFGNPFHSARLIRYQGLLDTSVYQVVKPTRHVEPIPHTSYVYEQVNWLTPAVLSVAAAIYDDRAFDRCPVLADMLEEAGYEEATILGHLRSPGPHVRGCWVLDLILGKE